MVTYRQKKHDFLFGVGVSPLDADDIHMFEKIGINYSSFVAGWQYIEPQQGLLSQEGFEGVNKYFHPEERKAAGFKLKAYGALYFNPLPDYLKTAQPELETITQRHIYETVKLYRDKKIDVNTWNAFDEPTNTNPLKLTTEQLIALTKISIESIRKANPNTAIHIDDFRLLGDERFLLVDEDNKFVKSGISFYQFLKKLQEDKITDYDGIELQFYPGGYLDALKIPNPLPTCDLAEFSEYLDTFSAFEKPIYLDQISAPSTFSEEWKNGWWHGKWDENIQARFLTAFYTVAFSKPYVKSISWFDGADKDAFIKSGGLFDKDKKPKEAYFALKNLIAGWNTESSAKTTSSGTFNLRGFAGEYDVTVIRGNKTKTFTVSIEERKQKQYALTF